MGAKPRSAEWAVSPPPWLKESKQMDLNRRSEGNGVETKSMDSVGRDVSHEPERAH